MEAYISGWEVVRLEGDTREQEGEIREQQEGEIRDIKMTNERCIYENESRKRQSIDCNEKHCTAKKAYI